VRISSPRPEREEESGQATVEFVALTCEEGDAA